MDTSSCRFLYRRKFGLLCVLILLTSVWILFIALKIRDLPSRSTHEDLYEPYTCINTTASFSNCKTDEEIITPEVWTVSSSSSPSSLSSLLKLKVKVISPDGRQSAAEVNKLNYKKLYNTTQWIHLLDAKTAGYLYAIANGARFIYTSDTGKSNHFKNSAFAFGKYTYSLTSSSDLYYNPYKHFSNINAWPNYLPVQPFRTEQTENLTFEYTKAPLIQTSVVIDSYKYNLASYNTDHRAPPVIVSMGTVSTYKASNSLFAPEAFWALFRPYSNYHKECVAWHSLWTQRLLWEIGGQLGLYSISIIKSSPVSEIFTLKQQYYDWAKVLRVWKCPEAATFFDCALLLQEQMSSIIPCNAYLKDMLQDWIKDLKQLGYPEPKRVQLNFTRNNDTGCDSAIVSYAVPQTLDVRKFKQVFVDRVDEVSAICSEHSSLYSQQPVLNPAMPVHNSIVLLIMFNTPHYDNIPMLEMTYKAVYPRIVYCGSNITAFHKSSQRFKSPVTFLEVDTDSGSYNYKCTTILMKMNYKVDGYLFIGDDALLNVNVVKNYPLDKAWITIYHNVRRSDPTHRWHNWMKPFGRKAICEAWHELDHHSKTSHLNTKSFTNFNQNLLKFTGFVDGIIIMAADIYYIPAKYQKQFKYFADNFFRHKVFLELAVANTIIGSVPKEDLLMVPGKYLWSDEERKNYVQYFEPDLAFLHPVKFGKEFKSIDGLRFFCEKFFPLQLFKLL